MKIKIAPSILSADFANLKSEVQKIEQFGADFLHLDVMDGHFVPNLTFGPDLIKSLRKHSKLLFDVHLMVSKPLNFIKDFAEAGADIITFHLETLNEKQVFEAINLIHSFGKKAGISIKPGTSETELSEEILKKIDLILLMTVEPGFGGQVFKPEILNKMQYFRKKIDLIDREIYLEVDGGINQETGAQAVQAGADVLVSGSYIFNIENETENRISLLKNLYFPAP